MTSQVNSVQQFPTALLARLNQMQRALQDLQSRIGFNENTLAVMQTTTDNQLNLLNADLNQTDQTVMELQTNVQTLYDDYASLLTALQTITSQVQSLNTSLASTISRLTASENAISINTQTINANHIETSALISLLEQATETQYLLLNFQQTQIDDLENDLQVAISTLVDEINNVYQEIGLVAQYLDALFYLDDFQALQIAWILLRDVLNNVIFPITRRTLIAAKFRNLTYATSNPTSLININGFSLTSVLVPPTTYSKLTGNFLSSNTTSQYYQEGQQTPYFFRLYSGTYTLHATLEYVLQPSVLRAAYVEFALAKQLVYSPTQFAQTFGLMSFEVVGTPATVFRGEDSATNAYRIAYETQHLPTEYSLDETSATFTQYTMSISLTATFEISTTASGQLQSALFMFLASCGNGINYSTYTGSLSPNAGRYPTQLTYTLDRKSSPLEMYKGYVKYPGGTTTEPLFANPYLNGLYDTYLV